MSHHEENDILRLLVYLSNKVSFIELTLLKVLGILEQETPVAKSLTISFSDMKGKAMANTITLTVGQTSQASAHEFSGLAGAGVELPLAGAISWASSDAAVATVDPASGLVTAVGPGTATITATDAANGLSGSGVVSDTPVVAQSLTVDFAPAA